MQRDTIRTRGMWAGITLLWLAAVASGLAYMAHYQQSAGVPAELTGVWPRGSRLALDATRPTLVMIAHPLCTCTRASLAELADLMARAEARPRAWVVFVMLGDRSREWEESDLWRDAAAIPDVTVVRDDGGVEAGRFGAETSGQTFLYDTAGALMFSGGTTGGRGHRGDNIGRATILALLRREATGVGRSSVFGCGLFAAGDRRTSEDSTDHGPHEH